METEKFYKKPKWFKPVPFPNWYKTLSTNFRHFFKQQYLIDVVFHCDNNQTIGSHKMILLQASPIFQDIFYECGMDSFNDDNIIHISLPETRKDILSDFLESLYLGAVPTDTGIFQEFQNLSELFMLFETYEKPQIINEVKTITTNINTEVCILY